MFCPRSVSYTHLDEYKRQMLFLSGGLERLGRVSEGTATLDFDPEEIKRKTSVTTAVAPVEWKNYKINLIDTPGLFDFEGSVCEAVRAADTMLIAVSAKSGVSCLLYTSPL